MELICIDDVTDVLNLGDGRKELTYGKAYDIKRFYYHVDEKRTQVGIINDLGFINEYLKSRFVTLEELRDIKLKEIGI